MDYGATQWSFARAHDGRLDFIQTAIFPSKADFERYWYSERLAEYRIELSGTGYHDHNWGFWDGVSWRWGQVQHEGLSYVYGRVIPPADAADPEQLPGFLVALGPDGPVGYTTRVTIERQ